ncbi:unnamed protein product [Lactuca virosa]|uniref:Uncharacterized protein n=1 Tax=Lactuca virosa TaxID=75947 RepID=A0AAU9PNN0_9ASTR|nr:unnamed protein product [Lactuca virosa]
MQSSCWMNLYVLSVDLKEHKIFLMKNYLTVLLHLMINSFSYFTHGITSSVLFSLPEDKSDQIITYSIRLFAFQPPRIKLIYVILFATVLTYLPPSSSFVDFQDSIETKRCLASTSFFATNVGRFILVGKIGTYISFLCDNRKHEAIKDMLG